MAQDFGRKQPAAFIGAAALLGFVASRFVMASANRPTSEQEPANLPVATSPAPGGYEPSLGTGGE
jgi:hypothetical protein